MTRGRLTLLPLFSLSASVRAAEASAIGLLDLEQTVE
jgi:hypothetical protein